MSDTHLTWQVTRMADPTRDSDGVQSAADAQEALLLLLLNAGADERDIDFFGKVLPRPRPNIFRTAAPSEQQVLPHTAAAAVLPAAAQHSSGGVAGCGGVAGTVAVRPAPLGHAAALRAITLRNSVK